MRAFPSSLATIAVLLLAPAGRSSVPQEALVPIDRRGPPVGSAAPAFRLADPTGRERTLADLAGEAGLVLLFVRSADW
jgi:hypothetical protein